MTTATGTRILAAVVTTVVIVAVIAALVLLGPPGVQRQRATDERRVNDLSLIENCVHEYWTRHQALAPDLASLASEPGFQVPRNDPETGQPYVY
jgi:hypothetical protein